MWWTWTYGQGKKGTSEPALTANTVRNTYVKVTTSTPLHWRLLDSRPGESPPQLVAIVVPFVRRVPTTLLLRRTVRLRRTESAPPGPPNDAFHHVATVWMAFGTWWMPFDSNIHFDNWQRAFVTKPFGFSSRFDGIQRPAGTKLLRSTSSPFRPSLSFRFSFGFPLRFSVRVSRASCFFLRRLRSPL